MTQLNEDANQHFLFSFSSRVISHHNNFGFLQKMAEKTKWLSVAIIPLLLSLFLGHSYVTIPSLECGALYLALGRTVAFPNSDGYTSSLRSYYALQSQQHAPSCIIRPQDNRQVSVAVTVLTYAARTMNAMGLRRPIFSIRGGGHSTSMTSVNNDGIVIDLSRMKTIQINDEQTVTSIGPGAKWVDVYLKLDAMGLAVPGGRVADVGVAGLTTGGSYFPARHLHSLVTICVSPPSCSSDVHKLTAVHISERKAYQWLSCLIRLTCIFKAEYLTSPPEKALSVTMSSISRSFLPPVSLSTPMQLQIAIYSSL